MLSAPPPPPPPAVTQDEFTDLRREVRSLKRELEDARDELESERAQRRELEKNLKHIVDMLVAQRQTVAEAQADDAALREHHRLMAELKEQRRSVSQPPLQ